MNWHRLGRGTYSGKTLPEVMLEDPDYVLEGRAANELEGPMRAEANEIRRRVAHMEVPRVDGEEPVVVFYNLRPDRSYGGLAIVPRSSRRLPEYARAAAAHTDGFFDLTVPRRIAPRDRASTLEALQAFVHHCLGARQTLGEFLQDERNFH
jgi:hypothetical protein